MTPNLIRLGADLASTAVQTTLDSIETVHPQLLCWESVQLQPSGRGNVLAKPRGRVHLVFVTAGGPHEELLVPSWQLECQD
eukprot:s4370_g6.t1